MKDKIITKLQNNIALSNDYIAINNKRIYNVNNIAVNKVNDISVKGFDSNHFEAINIEYISKGG